jgi:uncharacterized protein YggE
MFNNESAFGKKFGVLLLIIGAALTLFLLASTIKVLGDTDDVLPGEEPRTISVSGKGEMFAKPDVALITFSVYESASLVAEAQENSNKKMAALLAAVKNLGIDEKDVKTTNYYAGPKYEWKQLPCTQFSCPPGENKLVGYEVRQSISLKIRKIDDAGAVLAALGAQGASDISGLEFTVDDEDALKLDARTAAIEDAKAKAERLAKDLHVSLGDIVTFAEDVYYPVPMYAKMESVAMDMGMGGANPVSLPTGENKITSNVTITFEIK